LLHVRSKEMWFVATLALDFLVQLMTAPASSTRCRYVRGQRPTGSDAVPQLVDVDLEQRSAAVVDRPLPSDVETAFGHLITDHQGVEGADRVAERVDPGAFAGWIQLAFDDLNCSSPIAQRASGAEPGNAGTDDQNSNTGTQHGTSTG
jgi:hypothetical protein